jgi:O-methyltransferase involved in polyketide biosynthesis
VIEELIAMAKQFQAAANRGEQLGLNAAGFQQNSPAFFTWLGVVPYLTQDGIGRTLDYMSSIQNSEVVFDYVEPPEAFSEELRQLEKERTEQLEKIDNVRKAVSSRPALQRFFARTDFVPSKTSISRRSRPGSAAPFKDSRPDTLAFMLSTLSTN